MRQHFAAEVANLFSRGAEIDDGEGTVGEVDDGAGEGFVEGTVGVAETGEACGSLEGGFEGLVEVNKPLHTPSTLQTCRSYLSKRNERILRRVVIINMQVPSRPKLQTPASMFRQRMQHMIQEPNARVYTYYLRF